MCLPETVCHRLEEGFWNSSSLIKILFPLVVPVNPLQQLEDSSVFIYCFTEDTSTLINWQVLYIPLLTSDYKSKDDTCRLRCGNELICILHHILPVRRTCAYYSYRFYFFYPFHGREDLVNMLMPSKHLIHETLAAFFLLLYSLVQGKCKTSYVLVVL